MIRPGSADEGALERYWKYGAGAAKIRWGTPGDFTRLVRHIRKYVGDERAKRIAATWHFQMTGLYPGHHGGKNPNGPG